MGLLENYYISFIIFYVPLMSKEKKKEWRNTISTIGYQRVNNVLMIGVQEGEEGGRGAECLFKEIMTENFPNPGRNFNMEVCEVNRSPKILIYSNICQDTK